MTLEEIEEAISDKSIYSFTKQQLVDCLQVVAARDVGGNVNFHARLSKVSGFLNYLLTDIDAKEQLKQTTRTANTAILISIISIAVSIILTAANYLLTDRSSKETTNQLMTELQKIHKEEQRIFLCLSSNIKIYPSLQKKK